MGLRCLIGHEYGEPQTARDRTSRGNEVVVTVREYRECVRCGHRRVISENKEVTAGGQAAAGEPSAEASWEPDDADREEDQATVDAFARSAADTADASPEEPMTAAEDDGVILEDEPATPPPRGHGEWPEADLGDGEGAAEAEPEPWPDEEAAPEPEEPEPPEPPGPGEDPGDGGPAPSGTAVETDATQADTAEAQTPAPDRPHPRPDARNTEFVCPDCGETWPTQNASLRPGDICPECRQGYLDERVVQ